MQYLDFHRLDGVSTSDFRGASPYPWINPQGALTPEGFQALVASLPDQARFRPVFGARRAHGQHPHDRYALEYHPQLDVAAPWHEFISELNGERYRDFLSRLFGRRRFQFNFHWHYTPAGCSVSPHCDATRKLGSHIFYFNTTADWEPQWGGETLILDDHGRFPRSSAPGFDDFDEVIAGQHLGNYSLLFQRRHNSWHGVREITAPAGHYRKVFIVVINDPLLLKLHQLRQLFKGKPAGDY